MLGISKNDPRPLTVTGGMPYFGGPGNNYALHAISRMVELLREDPEKFGMVQALSWFISKHSVGIYSGTPPHGPYMPVDPKIYQEELDRLSGPEIVEEASGKGRVETYTVIHDREGRPVSSIIIGRLEDGKRFLAMAEESEEVYNEMMAREIIGETGRVQTKEGKNVFSFS
jgi:acetyl-CoA C-acetyltransferase